MNQEQFGKFIKKIREDNNLTQKDLALKYNITPQAVSKWENGLNMPDISLIKKISEDFNVSIDEMIEGNTIKKGNKLKIIIPIIIAILLIIFIVVYIILNKDNDFEFKTLSSYCSAFDISGSISYNKSKSAIYITNISYCGDDTIEYKEVECILYEVEDTLEKKISSYSYTGSITIEEFLESVTLTVDNYQSICKTFEDSNLYLVINATNLDGTVTSYDIRIVMEDSCE